MNIRTLLAAGSAALLASFVAEADAPARDVLDRYVELCGWLTDVAYTHDQRLQLRRQVEEYWRAGDQTKIGNVLRSLEMHEQLASASNDVRAVTLAQTRPQVLVSLQEDAARGGADSQWLYEQFVKANPPLALGKPGSVPLTRDTVDAALDHEFFMQTIVLNRSYAVPTQSSREAAYRAAANNYAQLSANQQMEVAAMPGRLLLDQRNWELAGPLLRAFIRAELGGQLTGQDQQLLSEFRSAGTRGQSALSAQLSAMQQDSETIMGGGTIWNSALGRWEQRGGIMTEYDSGVVRIP